MAKRHASRNHHRNTRPSGMFSFWWKISKGCCFQLNIRLTSTNHPKKKQNLIIRFFKPLTCFYFRYKSKSPCICICKNSLRECTPVRFFPIFFIFPVYGLIPKKLKTYMLRLINFRQNPKQISFVFCENVPPHFIPRFILNSILFSVLSPRQQAGATWFCTKQLPFQTKCYTRIILTQRQRNRR